MWLTVSLPSSIIPLSSPPQKHYTLCGSWKTSGSPCLTEAHTIWSCNFAYYFLWLECYHLLCPPVKILFLFQVSLQMPPLLWHSPWSIFPVGHQIKMQYDFTRCSSSEFGCVLSLWFPKASHFRVSVSLPAPLTQMLLIKGGKHLLENLLAFLELSGDSNPVLLVFI